MENVALLVIYIKTKHHLFSSAENAVTNLSPSELSPTVIALTLSNIILGIVTLILIWKLCKSQRKDSTGISNRTDQLYLCSRITNTFGYILQ